VEAPAEKAQAAASRSILPKAPQAQAVLLSQVDGCEDQRFTTGMKELDRILGGGAVKGSVVLVGGAPGIGKSTLLLQLGGQICAGERVLYISGEESLHQLKMRAERLGVDTQQIYVLAETDLSRALEAVEKISPTVLILDSIQTMYNPELSSAPGSVGQVKECTMSITRYTKTMGFAAFIVGHVNKEGAIAGPKVLEHMVDCVLYFEGEKAMSYRILRAAKNRFGSTNEIGVFEMADKGLREVANPSEMLLSGRPKDCPGTCVTCVIEGSRPILAEIQALASPSNAGGLRRNCNGLEFNRAMLLLAVIEKRGGYRLSSSDVYINVIGGLELDEPAADLAAVLAVVSSLRDKPIDGGVVAIGEVGLTGEIRAVNSLEIRLAEVARLGFEKCIIPANTGAEMRAVRGLELIPVRNIREALAAALR